MLAGGGRVDFKIIIIGNIFGGSWVSLGWGGGGGGVEKLSC